MSGGPGENGDGGRVARLVRRINGGRVARLVRRISGTWCDTVGCAWLVVCHGASLLLVGLLMVLWLTPGGRDSGAGTSTGGAVCGHVAGAWGP
jgi:hypothetical protein